MQNTIRDFTSLSAFSDTTMTSHQKKLESKNVHKRPKVNWQTDDLDIG